MDSLLSDEDIKDKGNKDMYSKSFDGKRNRATVQRGYSLIQLLVVMLLVSILARPSERYLRLVSDGLVVRLVFDIGVLF